MSYLYNVRPLKYSMHIMALNVNEMNIYLTTTAIQHLYHVFLCMRMPLLFDAHVGWIHSAAANAVEWNKRNKCKRDEKNMDSCTYIVYYIVILEGFQCAAAVLSENTQHFCVFSSFFISALQMHSYFLHCHKLNMTYNWIINYFFLIPADNKHLFDWTFFTPHLQFSMKKNLYQWFEYFTFLTLKIENMKMKIRRTFLFIFIVAIGWDFIFVKVLLLFE